MVLSNFTLITDPVAARLVAIKWPCHHQREHDWRDFVSNGSIFRINLLILQATLPNSATPVHRVALPVNARTSANKSQIPVTVSRAHLPPVHDVPGPSRHQPVHPSKIPGSAHNHGGIMSGMKVGRAGTARPLDMGSKFNEYHSMRTIPREMRHPKLTCCRQLISWARSWPGPGARDGTSPC